MTNPETPYEIAKRVLDGRGPSSSNGPALQRIVETLARALIEAERHRELVYGLGKGDGEAAERARIVAAIRAEMATCMHECECLKRVLENLQ